MFYIDNQNIQDPHINLALEEYVVRHFDLSQDYVLLYVNAPSIIIGKHQNTLEEINIQYVREHNLTVVRRISGGGTVYHDLNNLNFSFITAFDKKKASNYKYFNQPVVDALQKLGVPAEMNERNDILAQGKKISGNAQFSNMKRMFSHGTLLFDARIENVKEALHTTDENIHSKGVKSVRSKVANIRDFLGKDMTMEDFKTAILEGIFQTDAMTVPVRKLSDQEWTEVHKLAKEKYYSWEWNYGRSPKFTIERKASWRNESVQAKIWVKEGCIEKIEITGVLQNNVIHTDLEAHLLSTPYEINQITKCLNDWNLQRNEKIDVVEWQLFLCD